MLHNYLILPNTEFIQIFSHTQCMTFITIINNFEKLMNYNRNANETSFSRSH